MSAQVPFRPTELAHEAVRAVLRSGEAAVDATCGNGHDTAFLAAVVGAQGKVHAVDIQPEAVEATRTRLQQGDLLECVTLHTASHEDLSMLLPKELRGKVRAAMYNLGYLPGGDHTVTTALETTLRSLRSALPFLAPGGVLTVVTYRAHPGGAEETAAVRAWASGLSAAEYAVTFRDHPQNDSDSPGLIVVRKAEDFSLTTESLRERLFEEILHARQRVYAAGSPTPLERYTLDGGPALYLKREDVSPIHAYKWRGAYNAVALLDGETRARGVVTASAGNHAQGVALAAKKLGTTARIFMPVSTPRLKQRAVAALGGEAVETILTGDTYDEASRAAHEAAQTEGRTYIHAYDDLAVMGGQGTLADEIVMSGEGPFDVAYLQAGGGGMAAASACWLKAHFPGIRIVGVEAEGQAGMQAAIAAGKPVRLDYVDVFCDGTAVRQVGRLTHPLCAELIDEWVSVSNDQVCAAIQWLWEEARALAEPSGALGLAGLLQQRERWAGKKAVAILCGANLDFGQIGTIVRQASFGATTHRYWRIEIGETMGSMLELIDHGLAGLNIIEFQYGKHDETRAWPVIGVEGTEAALEGHLTALRQSGYTVEDVTGAEDVRFRIIRYSTRLMSRPLFVRLEFPERPGALRDFLALTSPHANLCYFNYAATGERVGRALMGFEFTAPADRKTFIVDVLDKSPFAHFPLSEEAAARIL